jgi:hypothetical protein
MAKKTTTKAVTAQKASEAPTVTGTELAKAAPVRLPAQTAFMGPDEWATAMEQAAVLVQSGMLPGHIKTAAQFLAIVVRGRELGLAPMEAISHLFLVNGKVSLDVQTQLGIIYRRLPGARVEVMENTAKVARVAASRPGRNPIEYSFTWEEAVQAGLSKKTIWIQYPKIMLLWRAIAQAARTEFPDVLAGVYAPGELPQDARPIEIEGQVVSSSVAQAVAADEIPEDAYDKKPPKPAAPPPAKVERVDTETGEVLDGDSPEPEEAARDEAPLVRGSDIKPPAKKRLF